MGPPRGSKSNKSGDISLGGKCASKIGSKNYKCVLIFMENIFEGNETNFNDK